MHEFNQSLKYDKRMYAADVKGSIAFSKALLKAGIVDEEEQKELERGLKEVEAEWRDGKVSLLVSVLCFRDNGISLMYREKLLGVNVGVRGREGF